MPTEAKEIFEANSRNVRELFSERGLGLYIPPYQRPYGWDKDKVGKLIEDIAHGFDNLLSSEESFTFLGTIITIHDINFTTVQPIVKDEVPGKVLTVIDGQQRLTSLILICLCLHNQLRLADTRLAAKMKKSEEGKGALSWIEGQTAKILTELEYTFFEKQPYGDAPNYPRMIRAFDDQWSRSKANSKYVSPISYLINQYVSIIQSTSGVDFKPIARAEHRDGEQALTDRFNQVTKLLRSLKEGKRKDELEEIPSFTDLIDNKLLQRALVNHEFPEDVIQYARSENRLVEFEDLLTLLLLSSYVLNRVALTVVRGKNEDYAFTVFESLNTTGEPLTAFETFKPRVVSAEGLERYESSASRRYLDDVSQYLSTFQVGEPLQAATRDLLIYFASAETGFKLSKRLADQRRYLKVEFERYETEAEQRAAFVRHLSDTSKFVEGAWSKNSSHPELHGFLSNEITDDIKLCLSFLKELNHTVAIAPLVRFYSCAIHSSREDRATRIKDFESACKAVTAFSVLWRLSRRGTAGIDDQYREMLSGSSSVTSAPGLCRTLPSKASTTMAVPTVNILTFKAELKARLNSSVHGDIPDLNSFVTAGLNIPAYTNNRPVSRFALLAAYHDSAGDTDSPGLIQPGKGGSCDCLNYKAFNDENYLSLEHIAPQTNDESWDSKIYSDKETVHRLGNLVLLPRSANSMLSNKTWKLKRVLYDALGASSKQESEKVLAQAKAVNSISFPNSTETIVAISAHLPHLQAIAKLQDREWTAAFIDERSKRLLELAWERLSKWLH